MRTIWKYTLGLTYQQLVDVPTGFEVRHVAPVAEMSPLGINVWCEVDTESPTIPTFFFIVGTGHERPPTGGMKNIDGESVELYHNVFCGTAVVRDGFVWHVYVERMSGVKVETQP